MAEDKWSRWLLKDRFGGDQKAIAAGTRRLMQFRDSVLDNARLEKGETLLDIGAGDCLIAFGAAERLGGDGRAHSFRLYEAGGRDDHPDAPAGPAEKLRAHFNQRPAPEGGADPLVDFDEKALLRLAEAAGFQEAQLHLEVQIGRSPPRRWDDYLQRSPNPNVGTLDQVLSQALTPQERREYEDYWRPVAERGGGRFESAVAFMWAVKPGGPT